LELKNKLDHLFPTSCLTTTVRKPEQKNLKYTTNEVTHPICLYVELSFRKLENAEQTGRLGFAALNFTLVINLLQHLQYKNNKPK